ncbi:MAG: hypothetical protein ABI400_14365 [Lacisediminihabitans sp.]
MHILLAAVIMADAVDDAQRSVLLLVCSALVLLMALGTSLFYRNPSRPATKIVLFSAGAVAVLWVLCGYGLSFGKAIIPGFLGSPIGLLAAFGSAGGSSAAVLHAFALVVFQGAVAVLTITIITSVNGHRVRLGAWLAFVTLWLILVYAPIAYSVFNMRDGWLFDGLQIVDQAGGTVVHISAGAALLALLVIFLPASERPQPPKQRMMVVGVCILWLGAFGLNIGSEGVVDQLFGTIILNTLVAPVVAAIAWSVTELLMSGRVTQRGLVSGLVTGIVAVAPACGILTPLWTVALAVLAGGICSAVVTSSRRSAHGHGRRPVSIHLVGGIVGVAYIGLFGNGVGWKDSGQPTGLADQAAAAVGVAAYSFVVTLVIAWVVHKSIGLKNNTAGARVVAVDA